MDINLSSEKIKKLMINNFNPNKRDEYIPLFEEQLASYFGVKNAIAVSSGTAAIHLALASLNIGKGDEVLVPATTVIMTVMPILYQGAIPVFVDCQKNSIDFDYTDLVNKITSRTKAIIPAYLWGCSYDMDKLLSVSQKYKLQIIEDACQAHGSKWEGKYLGTFGKIGCFSLKNGKILATGEGGFILTNDDEISEKCKLLRNHCTEIGNPEKSFKEVGWNYRITEMQAYLGILNLEKLDNKIEHRKLQTQYLYKQLKEVKELGIYDYKSKEESNLFSPLLWINGVNKGIKIAKTLSERGIINSTGTFGLIPANNRESIKKYCSTLNMYDKIHAINSENLLNNIIAVTLMEDYDKEKLDEIVKNIKELLK